MLCLCLTFNTTAIDGTAAVAGDVLTLQDSGVQIGTTFTLVAADIAAGYKDVVPSAELGEGAHSLTASITDQAGNASAASASVTVTVDTIAPLAPTISVVAVDGVVFLQVIDPKLEDYGIDVSGVAFTRVTLPAALTDSLEARRLASLQLAEQMSAPRMALLGDAAHAIHPIAGQGLNLGLKDAAALAEALVDALRLGEDIGSVAVLERYAAWRRFDNLSLAAATDVFNRLFSNDHPLVRTVRGIGMAVINRIGPARRFFMEEAGGAVGDLPRLLRGQPL